MTQKLDALLGLPVHSVKSLLQELAQLSERHRGSPELTLPLVTLHLRSGRSLSGYVLRVALESAGGEPVVLLHEPGADSRNPAQGVVYAGISAVECVTVHDAAVLLPQPPAPSRLELARRAAALSESLGKRVGAALTVEIEAPEGTSESALRTLGIVLGQLEAALVQIASEPLGDEAIKARLGRAVVAVGGEPATRWEERTFRVVARAGSEGPDSRSLKDALEKGL